MNRIKLTIVINIIIFLLNIILITNLLFKEKRVITIYEVVKLENDFGLKDSVLNYIKLHEGLRLKPYKCPGGYLTIGYGHKIKQNEHFNNITLIEAEAILKNDFEKAFKLTPNNLTYPKRLALAHFIFCLGIGNYNKSGLKQKVLKNEYIGNEIIRWQYVKGKPYKSLLKARLFELQMYYN